MVNVEKMLQNEKMSIKAMPKTAQATQEFDLNEGIVSISAPVPSAGAANKAGATST